MRRKSIDAGQTGGIGLAAAIIGLASAGLVWLSIIQAAVLFALVQNMGP